MSDPSKMPVPPWRPGREDDRPLKPDAVEWWTPRREPPGGPEPIAPEPGPVSLGRPNYLLHLGLFLATCLTTYLTGGIYYAGAIMAILLAHEMGHYVMARRYGVSASLPYFIPLPVISLFGTMGAVIRMSSLGADRKVLFDIGVAGPIAGLVLAIPAAIIGIARSEVVEASTMSGNLINLGSPLLFQWISDWIKGPTPEGYDIILHPLAFAGWAGFFVTALNLLPVGQFDGGHSAYALFGRRGARVLSDLTVLGLLGMAVFISQQWLVLAFLLFLLRRHPPTANDQAPIDTKRKIIAGIMLVLLVLMFTPRPFTL